MREPTQGSSVLNIQGLRVAVAAATPDESGGIQVSTKVFQGANDKISTVERGVCGSGLWLCKTHLSSTGPNYFKSLL